MLKRLMGSKLVSTTFRRLIEYVWQNRRIVLLKIGILQKRKSHTLESFARKPWSEMRRLCNQLKGDNGQGITGKSSEKHVRVSI